MSSHRRKRSRLASVVALAFLFAGIVAVAAPAGAAPGGSTTRVTSTADGGPGSFRAAVEAANADAAITTIRFDRGLDIEVATAVRYTGAQDLTLIGRGSTVRGAAASGTANPTWDGGLFVSDSDADLALRDLSFVDSFNNGLAVFVPATATGTVELELRNVTVSGAKFHGVFFDGQASSGYNTDDIPHPACTDPHPYDSDASLEITVVGSRVIDNGTLAGGFDDSLATGCPRDFDGVRVDDGGIGGIAAEFAGSHFDRNLADGVELDESEVGGVDMVTTWSTFDGNGNSGEQIDGEEDLDDGLDIDEVDDGDVVARVFGASISNNYDEGLDLDEAGEGDVDVSVVFTTADGNEDEGLKADEEDGGSLTAAIAVTSVSNNISNDGVQMAEIGDGDNDTTVLWSRINGNLEGDGLKVEQEDAGTGSVAVYFSDLSGNDSPYDFSGLATETLVGVTL